MITRALVIWLLLMLAETIHGILRGLLLVPLVGQIRANQIGVAFGSLLILVISILTIKWIKAVRISELLTVGIVWVLLTLAFEVGLGYVFGGWDRVSMDYDPRQGGLMPLGLLIMFFSPFIARRMRS
ncbi:MAG: hypothetical protein IPI64_02160 [Chloracidobacterium sp.]|nr:hypothetical protein [Chloracidobacterium sp.]